MDEAQAAPGAANGCRFIMEPGGDDEVTVSVIGDLDPMSARVLLALVESAIGMPGTSRGVEVDLRRLRGCSSSGIRALTMCAELGSRVREGLHFRVGGSSEDGLSPPDGSARMTG
jgi:hypothetical protein